jgi:WD40 repeat protein
MRLLSDKSGFGLVYEAFERSNPKILKVLKGIYNTNEKAIELFQQEAAVLSQLHHPGIPAIEPDGYFQFQPRNQTEVLHCIVMEKIDGPNLREWMRQQGNHPIGEKQAIQWLRQLAEILHLVHQKNYFHRDIKPENIMLRSTGQVVLVDFGAAREMTYTYLAQLGKTGGITRISSAGYTPPEQEKGQAVPQSDFYALGYTFIYLLTGKQPTESSMYDSLNNEFHWRQFAPHLSSHFADFIDQLTAARASDRPKDTQAVLMALAEVEQTRPEPPSPSMLTVLQQTIFSAFLPEPLNNRPKKRLLWGGAAIVTLALGGYGIWHFTHSAQPDKAVVTEPIQVKQTLKGHQGFINTVLIAHNGNRLISGGTDNTIKIWDIATGQMLKNLSGHTSFINALDITSDDRTLVSAGADSTVRIWDLVAGRQRQVLQGHKSYINALIISPDGQLLASGGADQVIHIWELSTGKLRSTLVGHHSYVNALTFTPDGQRLISASADRTLKVWDVGTGKEIFTLQGHEGFVNAVVVTPDGQNVISGSADKTIRIWNLATGQPVRILARYTSFINALLLKSNGQTLISGNGDGTVVVWDLASGAMETKRTYGGEIKRMAISPDGQTIACGNGSAEIKIWKLP